MATDPQLQLAAQLISKGQINEAKQIITQVIRANDHNADAWYLAASIMEDANRQIQALERTLAINPNHQRAQHALARIKGETAHGQVPPARAERTSAMYSARDYIDTGLMALEHNDIPGAFSAFTKALQLDPNSAEAYAERGKLYQADGDLDSAIADYKEVLRLSPRYPQADEMRELVENAGKPDWIAYQQGLNSCDSGDFSRALDHFNEAIKLNGKIASYYVGRARAFQERGNLNAALSDLDKAVKLDSKSPDVLMARGRARALKGDFNGAINDFSQVIKIDDIAVAYLERGKAESEKENFKAALKDLTQAINLDPELAAAFGYRGLARLHLKDVNGAHEDYLAAVELEPAQMQATELLIKIEQTKLKKR
jgi:tetratricopeptide (TPR) repeat protein